MNEARFNAHCDSCYEYGSCEGYKEQFCKLRSNTLINATTEELENELRRRKNIQVLDQIQELKNKIIELEKQLV